MPLLLVVFKNVLNSRFLHVVQMQINSRKQPIIEGSFMRNNKLEAINTIGCYSINI